MTISRRTLLKGIGATGLAAGNTRLVDSVLAEALTGVRPSFTNFRLASSSLIDDGELSGIRLRWNFPLFNQDGTFANCLPDRVIVHRDIRPISSVYIPKSPDVGLTPIALYPDYCWRSKLIVQVSSNPAVFEFRQNDGARTAVQAINFGYRGTPTVLKVLGANGKCLLIARVTDGAEVYFDAAEIIRFELGGAANVFLSNPRCLDILGGGELHIDNPIAELEVRRPLVESIGIDEGALRLNGLAGSSGTTTTLPTGQDFMDAADWKELIALGSEVAAPVCVGQPALDIIDGAEISKTDLFMVAAVSRWEMAPRLGFGFRDGKNRSRSKYDYVSGPELNLGFRKEVAFYQVRAVWDKAGRQVASNVASSRLDESFGISRPSELQYLARVSGKFDSDFIAISPVTTNVPSSSVDTPGIDRFAAQTLLRWSHFDHQRVSGILISEQVKSPNGNSVLKHEWIPHRGVFDEGFRGNARHNLQVDLDDTVTSEIRSFDGWDTVSPDMIAATPKVVLSYAPAAPKLACATHRASLDEVDGQVLIERLVTAPGFRPSCLPATPADGSAALDFAEWQPDALLQTIIQKNFQFRLELMESIKRPKRIETNIREYGRDGRGGFVRIADPVDFQDYVGGALDAENGRYHVRSFVSDRLYIGRFEASLSDGFDQDGTCQLTSAATNLDEMDEPLIGRCTLSQNHDADEFWQTVKVVAQIGADPIDFTFLAQPLTPRPVDLPDTVEYRLRLVGQRNTQMVIGEYSNFVTAQRLPMRPPKPRGLVVRQLGYDYYDRLLVCVQLMPQDVPGNYRIFFAPGQLDVPEAFIAAAEPATLIGQQSVGSSLTLFEALPIGRNFQTDRVMTIGVSRMNAAGTSSAPAIGVIIVPVE
jgi:hypothetical protein